MRLVLASASPRRRELLEQAGFAFEVRVAGIDETRRAEEPPGEYVRRLALEKAQAVFAAADLASSAAKQIPPLRCGMTTKEGESASEDESVSEGESAWRFPSQELVVLGADTTVVLGGEVMNKPTNRADAERMLRALSGRMHQVLTGVAVVGPQCALTHAERTDVVFRELTEEELRTYLDSGDALDKAGAYGIQGYAARWIPRIDGDYFNVVGLPIAAVVNLLRRCKECDAVERGPDHVL